MTASNDIAWNRIAIGAIGISVDVFGGDDVAASKLTDGYLSQQVGPATLTVNWGPGAGIAEYRRTMRDFQRRAISPTTDVAVCSRQGGQSLCLPLNVRESTVDVCQRGMRIDDIYVAKRADTAAAFGAPQNLTGLNSDECDTRPRLTADGLTLYWGSVRAPNVGGFDIWRTHRPC